MSGSGKSTLAKKLAEIYGLTYRSGGDALKLLASEMGYRIKEKGWWESDEGIQFLQARTENPELDKRIDAIMIEWAKKGDVVLDSWAVPWLIEKGFKVWLEASEETRAERISERDNLSLEDAKSFLKIKESGTKSLLRKLYGFNLGEDFEPFDLILDVNILASEEVLQVVCAAIDDFKRLKETENRFN
jgi:cytidylate kinase